MNAQRIATLVLVGAPLAVGRAQHAHLAAQPTDSATARFIAEARAGTTRYRDQGKAIEDGYRRVGPDLPAMGEHWLSIRLVLADTIDATHPSVLIYVSSPGGPVLAGAAYTRLLGVADSYPDFPHGFDAWHDHSGFVDEEALPTHHMPHVTAVSDTARTTRLGILHLWMWQANPDGLWTADNWALPFVRAGVPPPHSGVAAAHALTLAADSGRYYRDVIVSAARLDSAQARQLDSVLGRAAARVQSIPLTRGAEPTSTQLEELRAIWQALWPAIEQTLTPGAVAKLQSLRRLWW